MDAYPSPAPWVLSLQLFVKLVRPVGVDWMLVGSAATAARRADLAPADLDILARQPKGVTRMAAVMPPPYRTTTATGTRERT